MEYRPSWWVLFWAILVWVIICSAGYRLAHADIQADPKPITWKSCSSAIASAGAAQNAPSSPAPVPQLRGFFLQNPSTATESLFFDPSGAASTTFGVSVELLAGASVTFGPGTIFAGTMSVNAVTPGHRYVCLYGQ